MGARIPVDLNGKHFPTKDAAKAYFKQILHGAKDSGSLPQTIVDEEQIQMLEAILETDNEAAQKLEPGLDYFFVDYVRNHPELNKKHINRKNDITTFIERLDGTVVDFSATGLVDDYSKDTACIHKADVKSALREAIEPYRLELRENAFRGKREVICPRTFIKMTNAHQARVIYKSPSWEKLTSDFVSTIGGWDKIELFIDQNNVQQGKRLSDRKIEHDWIEYWKTNSSPIICARIE
ncbi:MAG: DUF3223 domain-containing protein [Bifidobacterium psychraerophilum]|uniref:DUF3223 domain-containing protein n=1 Tax=Bifidobacterium psychraerophilum TaxID=218140 RepID=UPI0039EB65DA